MWVVLVLVSSLELTVVRVLGKWWAPGSGVVASRRVLYFDDFGSVWWKNVSISELSLNQLMMGSTEKKMHASGYFAMACGYRDRASERYISSHPKQRDSMLFSIAKGKG